MAALDAGRRQHEDMAMTSVPELTRILAHIAEWQQDHGKPGSRADAVRRLTEAQELLDEISNLLVEIRRELMSGSRRR